MAGNLNLELPHLQDVKGAYKFIKTNGLLKPFNLCPDCKTSLKTKQSSYNRNFEALVCVNQSCPSHRVEIESLSGSFFEFGDSSIGLSTQLHCIKYWCDRRSSTIASTDLGISEESALNYFKKCQNFITDYYNEHPIQLGGNGNLIAVRVTEILRVDTNKDYLLTALNPKSFNEIGYMEVLRSGTKDPVDSLFLTALEKIIRVIIPDSIVAFDGDIDHLCKNTTRLEFIPCDRALVDALDDYEVRHDATIRDIKLNNPEDPQLLLNECMWRERIDDDAFRNFIGHLRQYYNPSN